MRLDRDLWQPKWKEGEFPSLPCPTCGALLNLDTDSLEVRTSCYMREQSALAGVEAVQSQFCAWLVCGHAKCGEVVAVSGDCSYQYAYDNMGNTVTERVFHPKFLCPGPPVISINSDVPQSIRDALADSFALMWISNEACASRLRVVLDLILEEWDIPREHSGGKFVSLHRRIADWNSRYSNSGVAQSLMAVKWLGNVGSHDLRISRSKLLDGYEILSRLLVQLFPSDDSYLDELADEIVKLKGQSD